LCFHGQERKFQQPMSVQNSTKYSFKNIFSLTKVVFEKACKVDHSVKQSAYIIYWIQEGKGTYNIHFVHDTFTDTVLYQFSLIKAQ